MLSHFQGGSKNQQSANFDAVGNISLRSVHAASLLLILHLLLSYSHPTHQYYPSNMLFFSHFCPIYVWLRIWFYFFIHFLDYACTHWSLNPFVRLLLVLLKCALDIYIKSLQLISLNQITCTKEKYRRGQNCTLLLKKEKLKWSLK